MSDATELWDAEATDYDEPADHGLRDPAVRAAWRELLLAALPPAPARVADLGCGTATLSLLLAEEGYAVDGVDFSPEMVRRARAKVAGRAEVTVTEGDAGFRRSARRRTTWCCAGTSSGRCPTRWPCCTVGPGCCDPREDRPGRGLWTTGAGLTAAETVALLEQAGRGAEVTRLGDAAYWGREISDERYLVVS